MLAAVTVGCYVGWQAPQIASPATRLQGFGMWELLQFLLNAFLFVLIGLQLPADRSTALDGHSTGDAARLRRGGQRRGRAHRLVWQQTIVFLIRAVDRRESRARAGVDLAAADDRRLGGHARRGLAGRRARAPAATSRSAT